MRDVFGVISIVIQNLSIAQEDIECDKKKCKILRLTQERLDVQIIASGYNDGRNVTFIGKHCDDNNLDYMLSSSTINKFVTSENL